MEQRVNRADILLHASEATGLSLPVMKMAYKAIVDTIVNEACKGNVVCLNGFGTYYLQTHKGHPVRFGAENKDEHIGDYLVFKFSASHLMNAKIRKQIAAEKEEKGE